MSAKGFCRMKQESQWSIKQQKKLKGSFALYVKMKKNEYKDTIIMFQIEENYIPIWFIF